jgi:hypothetical protein
MLRFVRLQCRSLSPSSLNRVLVFLVIASFCCCDDTDEDVERLLEDDESISDIVLPSCSKRASKPIFILYISPIRGFFVNNPIKKPIRGENCFSLSFSVSNCN